jgi:8-oxo-dGTP pyrophosphatase MutT (NUDIX family)
MRRLIERRLAALADGPGRDDDDPRASLLTNLVGPRTAELEAVLAQPRREAAVLIPIIERTDGLKLLFTERSRNLPHHAGQVSFPGGVTGSAESVTQAALREAHEEVGLAPDRVEVAGRLRRHLTGTGFMVTPVVGFVPGDFEPVPDPDEVEAAFEVPLGVLLERDTIRSTVRARFATRFTTYEIDYGGFRIWGATAAILVTFLELISDGKTEN